MMTHRTPLQLGNALTIIVVLVALLGLGAYFLLQSEEAATPTTDSSTEPSPSATASSTMLADGPVTVTPISHATMVLEWNDVVLYVDPVGGAEAFAQSPTPEVIVLSDTDPDHLNLETLEAVATTETILYAPQAVYEELPAALQERTTVLENGDQLAIDAGPLQGFSLEAVAMYNQVAEGEEAYHPKGKGNGYVLEHGEYRLYLAGDTEDVPELRAQQDIDLAFVPMNLPYTMGVEAAATGTVAFAPEMVVPYHFRTPDGFSDITEFRRLVNEADPDITVRFLDFYPDTTEDGV